MTGGGIRLGTPADHHARNARSRKWSASPRGSPKCSRIWATPQREQRIRAEVAEFAAQFPLYTRRWDIAPTLAGSRGAAR